MTRRLFLLAAVAAAILYAEDFARKVVAITRMRHNGASERSRLWWNDGPPRSSPSARAKQLTGAQAFRQTVTVKVRDIDRCKRTAAEIILPDWRKLNQELVRAELALWHQQSARRELVLRDLVWKEQEARDATRGLWSDLKPVEPWEWRKAAAAARKL